MPEFELNRRSKARRVFLGQCCKTAAALLIPNGPVRSSPDPDFHLHPRYREQTPLDASLVHLRPGLDGFRNEPFHDTVAAILDTWSAGLLESPIDTQPIQKAFSSKFKGASWRPSKSDSLRAALVPFQSRSLIFPTVPSLDPQAFIGELEASLSVFSKLLAAEFQITNITHETTRVHYELVGTGPGFYREQRTGYWSIEWSLDQVAQWQHEEETRVRSAQPYFRDISANAFGSTKSYSAQMLHGADHWRSILDGACGIDIYGHNGVSIGDIDGNGLDDIYICQPAGLPNRLYRNRGDGTFEDMTEAAGVGLLDNTACALFADFHNRGHQDLVVVRSTGPLLFENDGTGRFQLKPDAFRFATPPQGTFTGAAAADYDRDGFLDIYFCLYTYYQGADQYKYPSPYFAAENGPSNFLMRNQGGGTFSDVTSQTGLDENNTRFSFCCGWSDYNNDGWPDLYVVNDFGRKNLYRNNGDGTFTDVAAEAGVEDVGAGMSVSWVEDQKLYVGNMWTAAGERLSADAHFQQNAPKDVQAFYRKHAMGNSLFQKEANAFRNVTSKSQTAIGRWSWSSDSWDFDHNGSPDIYVTNGMISGFRKPDLNSFFWRQVVAKSPNTAKSSPDYEQGWNAVNELIRSGFSWSGYERNVLFVNNGDGTFTEASAALGLDFPEDSRAFALADFDRDGRYEVLLKNRNAPQIRLLKNTAQSLPPSISFRLQGTKSNRDAIGARLTVGSQTKFLQAGSGFLSQHSKEIHFGLGNSQGPLTATIKWPSGLEQRLEGLPVNHCITVIEGSHPTFKPFDKSIAPAAKASPEYKSELTPIATWLLAPIEAPTTAKQHLITIDSNQDSDLAAIYNLLFSHVYDNHQDLSLPTSFLLDDQGRIVRIYQGRVHPKVVEEDVKQIPVTDQQRLAKALPFPGVSTTYTYGRNYLSLGSIFFQRGYLGPSAIYFQAALKDNPVSAEAYYGLGSIYLKQQHDEVAQSAFERVTQLQPAYPETMPNAWNNLGLLATRKGDTVKAIEYFEKALQVSPDHFVALENLGSAYRQQKRWPEARETLEHALTLKPDDPEANYSLAMVFAQTNDSVQAYDHLEKALRVRPSYPEALNNLGVLYLRTHRPEEAVSTFEKCIELSPSFDQSYMNLARVYVLEGNTAKARTVLLALLSQHPDHPQAKQALAQLDQK